MQTVYGRKAWLVWAASIVVYIVAMMHRSSLGVAGLEAAEHFGTTAGIVSTFVVLQLTTYALAQLPAGALLDRYGSRAMLVVGTVAVGLGQVMLALVDDLPLAYAARVFLGLGDACIFNSVNQLGAATGIVITGGFVGGTVLILRPISFSVSMLTPDWPRRCSSKLSATFRPAQAPSSQSALFGL